METGLANTKVGDTVVIQDVNRGMSQHPVTAVGRKYLTANGHQFDIATGGWKSKGYSGHKTAYSIPVWERLQLEKQIRQEVKRLQSALEYRTSMCAFSEQQLQEWHTRFRELADTIEGRIRGI